MLGRLGTSGITGSICGLSGGAGHAVSGRRVLGAAGLECPVSGHADVSGGGDLVLEKAGLGAKPGFGAARKAL